MYGVLEGMSIAFAAMLEWSLGEGRTRITVPPDRRWAAWRRFASGGLAYLLVIGGAFLNPLAALGFSGLVGLYYIFERTPLPSPPDLKSRKPPTTRSAETDPPLGAAFIRS